MSLFKTREFWSTECDMDEKFDQNSMLIAKLNSSTDYVIVGSHVGIIRIFHPANEIQEGGISGYQPTDLFLEKIFPSPILQLAAGRLVSGSKLVQLAILHPRSVGVYSLNSREGLTNHGTQNTLQLMYEHKLRRSASNFTIGLFGGSQNRDFICVQSLDGNLTFFEQETFVCCCFLPNFLLPGPLIYVRRSDSFVTATSAWTIDSYRYKQLSEAGQNSDQEDITGKKIICDWSYNLGEGVLDMQCVADDNIKESYIGILGERNYYCLTQNGKLKFMKRLEYPASCFHLYNLDNKIMSLIVSETNTILIYQETTLKWSAHIHIAPIAIGRAFLKNILGAIVLLAEDGIIKMSYLGTEPSLFSAPPMANQELDFEKAEAELITLNKIIKSTFSDDLKLSNENAERELVVTINVNPHLETESNEKKKRCEVSIDVLPQALFEEVQVVILVQKPLKVFPNSMFYSNLSDRAKFFCYVSAEENLEVPSLLFRVKASFITSLGVPRITTKEAVLPLSLVMEACTPVKENEYKLTLNINQSIVPLSTLFPEEVFLSEYAGENTLTVNSNAIGFRYLNGISNPVTILIAKSSQRYRLQSDSFISMNIIVQEMVRRLKKYYSTNDDFVVTVGSSWPMQPVLDCVNKHFGIRQTVIQLEEELNQLGAQFRLIQKRLISKFKDKNPTPLTKLDILLNDTYNDISETLKRLQEEHEKLIQAQIELSCALMFVLNLLRFSDVDTDITLLESTFSPYVYDTEKQNWEDTMDASLCYMLRTVLAKSEKDKLRAPHTSFDEIKDIAKLEKHFTTVVERITKKGIVSEALVEETDISDVNEAASSGKDLIPIGSRIGESSSRAISARKGGVRKRENPNES